VCICVCVRVRARSCGRAVCGCIHMCDRNHSDMGHDSFVRDMIHLYVCETRVHVLSEALYA